VLMGIGWLFWFVWLVVVVLDGMRKEVSLKTEKEGGYIGEVSAGVLDTVPPRPLVTH
jgi:hypothetical protein